MAKILRKSQGSISKAKFFYWSKIDVSSLLHSNLVLLMKLKFEYTRVITKV